MDKEQFRSAEFLADQVAYLENNWVGELMYISHLVIKNLRALEDIDCELSRRINVIVGPNAVGKTTILQACRLSKALLAPRTQQEIQQVLVSLGAASPHFPQRVFLNSLARDLSRQIEIRCTYVLTDDEISVLRGEVLAIVQSIVASRLGQSFSNPATLIPFMQSPDGRRALEATQYEVLAGLDRLQRDKTLLMGITLNGLTGQMSAVDPLSGPLIGFLDQRLPPHTSVFSYYHYNMHTRPRVQRAPGIPHALHGGGR